MRLYLIRHAESENNVLTEETVDRRKVDPDLTPLGYQQRDLLARFLANEPDVAGESFEIDHLYTSAMYRSLLTTQPVSDALRLAPMVWPDLHEKGGMFSQQNGHISGFNGMSRSAILGGFPGYQLPEEVTDCGWYDAAMGREPEPHSYYRAIKVARELRERGGANDVIALVSHAGFLDILLKALFEQLPSRPYTMRYYHDNTAITRINYQGPRPTLHYMNRVDHLPADLRSY
jgi:broad specificity phosphatase PhoE